MKNHLCFWSPGLLFGASYDDRLDVWGVGAASGGEGASGYPCSKSTLWMHGRVFCPYGVVCEILVFWWAMIVFQQIGNMFDIEFIAPRAGATP